MQKKEVIFRTRGMNQDLSESKTSTEFSYENMNLRITPTDDNTFLSLCTEQGNSNITLQSESSILNNAVGRVILGYAVINSTIILFSKVAVNPVGGQQHIYDVISKVYREEVDWYEDVLYHGDLKFNTDNPIETLALYESEDIQKVYWVDGINQPRVINITGNILADNNTQFDFLPSIITNENVAVTRVTSTQGMFPGGTLQYCITYSKKNGQETKILWTSNVIYPTFDNRAASPDENTSASYNISISSVDTSFDYINIYSLIRTAESTTPTARLVTKINIDPALTSQQYQFLDTNTTGEFVDSSFLLFVGGSEFTAGTITSKDNVLFLGDIKTSASTISTELREIIDDNIESVDWSVDHTVIDNWELTSGYITYKNPLLNDQVTYLKAGNTYRLGFQLQSKTGEWSEPIFIKDYQATYRPYVSDKKLRIPKVEIDLPIEITEAAYNEGYRKIRPIIVYPESWERGVIAQGITCPTVFKADDRVANAPYAQSSWFFRPYYKKLITSSTTNPVELPYIMRSVEYRHAYALHHNSFFSAEVQYMDWTIGEGYDSYKTAIGEEEDFVNNQYFFVDDSTITFHSPDVNDNLQEGALSTASLNIVGAFTLDSVAGRYILNTKLGVSSDEEAAYNKLLPTADSNLSTTVDNWADPNGIKSNLLAVRTPAEMKRTAQLSTSHMGYPLVYPWHNQNTIFYPEEPAGSLVSGDESLNYKVISNIRASQSFAFYDYAEDDIYSILDSRIYRKAFNEATLGLANTPEHNIQGTLFYSGSYNRLITPNEDYNHRFMFTPNKAVQNPQGTLGQTSTPVFIQYSSTDHVVLSLDSNLTLPTPNGFPTHSLQAGEHPFWLSSLSQDVIYSIPSGTWYKLDRLPVPVGTPWRTNIGFADNDVVVVISELIGRIPNPDYVSFTFYLVNEYVDSVNVDERKVIFSPLPFSSAPVGPTTISPETNVISVLLDNSVKYIDATGEKDTITEILERYGYSNKNVRSQKLGITSSTAWKLKEVASTKSSTKVLPSDLADYDDKEVMWITELTRPIPGNIFGGNSEYAKKNNKWVPCGQAETLSSSGAVQLFITEGDTIFSRWDCLKTMPRSKEDVNQVVEIMSFMCESYVNTAGRYDKYRNLQDYTFVTPEVAFNDINSAYNNRDDFFSYRIVDVEKESNKEYPNKITWSLTKTLGEDTDTWTNISLASILDLDGNKGRVRALRRFKNSILAFQDRAIAEVLFNSSAAISTTSGVPIELANSGKVEGKRYLSEDIGCVNKWSICTTPNGLYFVDNINKKIYLFSEGLQCLSTKLGFDTWVHNNLGEPSVWNPIDFNDIIVQYDREVGDVYFITSTKCLAYNERIGTFSSFYSYEHTPFLINFDDKSIAIHREEGETIDKFWLQRSGIFCNYFGQDNEYYTDVIVNEYPTQNKIFSNVEFRADSWVFNGSHYVLDHDLTFEKLRVWNEYQDTGNQDLSFTKNFPSNLKKKFRVWSTQIGRNAGTRDRIRNPWAHVKLWNSGTSNDKTVLHDLTVVYYI